MRAGSPSPSPCCGARLVLSIVVVTTAWLRYFGVVTRGDACGRGQRRLAWTDLHPPLHVGAHLLRRRAKLLRDSMSLLHGGLGWLLIAPLVLTMLVRWPARGERWVGLPPESWPSD